MQAKTIKSIKPLGFQWDTSNPFLFCVHHKDAYPEGNAEMGPEASLSGRSIGHDFVPKDGWRMYHGEKIPGFPVHPHRGFETITIVLEGMVDHADSLGAAGRYGMGDVQWMTAGEGIQHTEMFPLLNRDKKNPLELFQIWLNLPAADKFVKPHYTMLWKEDIPVIPFQDKEGKTTEVTLIAGNYAGKQAPPPPPASLASKKMADVAILLIRMDPGAEWEIPGTMQGTERSLYFYRGDTIFVNRAEVPSYQAIQLEKEYPWKLKNGTEESYLMLLQARPLQETVVQYGPFVMNSRQEIQQAFEDYRKTEFGGWPWPRPDQVHDREMGRFARYADGKEEKR
ncbi:MAG: pirin family protein [Bacteroidales bacterium]|nr:pirin family protein [Bacteroidales bacterium]